MTTIRPRARLTASDQPMFISRIDPGGFDACDGPLAGLTVGVKDNIDVAGVATTAACPARTEPAQRHAEAVTRLLCAGAVPVGKTNMDQFATGLVGTRSPYGACHSIYSTDHISGGSSSGSAVAVASGTVPLALGTDTAGSGRVPAAFNGLVGMKPSRGLISNTGLLPASPSLDCITTFTRDVALARRAFDILVGPDPADPYSRTSPIIPPAAIARRMRVIAVPANDDELDLDDTHRAAWQLALAHVASIARIVRVDISPFLAAAKLLYDSALVAERFAAFGHRLEPDGPHLDPVVRSIVLQARGLTADAVFAGLDRLAHLRAQAERIYIGADALLLPVTPTHPTLAEVAADPIGTNVRLGTYTNMVNLLDLCAIALPSVHRTDGLPFGVQLIAPAFADRPLLDLGSRWMGEAPEPVPVGTDRVMLAVAGAHLSGQPRNADLVDVGGRLHSRVTTAPGYRMYRVPGPFPRPGLVHGNGPDEGIDMELWDLPHDGLGRLLPTIAPPLSLGQVTLDDHSTVVGFIADGAAVKPDDDITQHRGWRAYLASTT